MGHESPQTVETPDSVNVRYSPEFQAILDEEQRKMDAVSPMRWWVARQLRKGSIVLMDVAFCLESGEWEWEK